MKTTFAVIELGQKFTFDGYVWTKINQTDYNAIRDYSGTGQKRIYLYDTVSVGVVEPSQPEQLANGWLRYLATPSKQWAIAVCERKAWTVLNDTERAILQFFIERRLMPLSEFGRCISCLLGRNVYTHELGCSNESLLLGEMTSIPKYQAIFGNALVKVAEYMLEKTSEPAPPNSGEWTLERIAEEIEHCDTILGTSTTANPGPLWPIARKSILTALESTLSENAALRAEVERLQSNEARWEKMIRRLSRRLGNVPDWDACSLCILLNADTDCERCCTKGPGAFLAAVKTHIGIEPTKEIS